MKKAWRKQRSQKTGVNQQRSIRFQIAQERGEAARKREKKVNGLRRQGQCSRTFESDSTEWENSEQLLMAFEDRASLVTAYANFIRNTPKKKRSCLGPASGPVVGPRD
jgi:hypothetical protein